MLKETMAVLNYVESTYPVEDWVINNIHIWPLIRMNISIAEKKDIFSESDPHSPINYPRWIRHIKTGMSLLKTTLTQKIPKWRDSSHNDTIHEADVVCFVSPERRTRLDDYYYLYRTQSFLQQIPEYSSCVLEYVFSVPYLLPRYEKTVFINDLVTWHFLKTRLNLFIKKCPKTTPIIELFEYEKCFIDLQDKGFSIPTVDQLVHLTQRLIFEKGFWYEILKRIKPKLVVIECYYVPMGMALILACNEMGISSADLQHGTQHTLHMAYASWKPVKDGYELLPKYFLVWSNFEKKNIEQWSYKCKDRHIPLVIGHSWLRMWFAPNIADIFRLILNRIHKQIDSSTQYNILFSMDYSLLPQCIFVLIAASPPHWKWWIRMHPVVRNQWPKLRRDMELEIASANINIEEASEMPLPALLTIMDLHITWGSTIALECAMLGIPSIMEWEMPGYEGYNDFIEHMPLKDISIDYIEKKLHGGRPRISFDSICAITDGVQYLKNRILSGQE